MKAKSSFSKCIGFWRKQTYNNYNNYKQFHNNSMHKMLWSTVKILVIDFYKGSWSGRWDHASSGPWSIKRNLQDEWYREWRFILRDEWREKHRTFVPPSHPIEANTAMLIICFILIIGHLNWLLNTKHMLIQFLPTVKSFWRHLVNRKLINDTCSMQKV